MRKTLIPHNVSCPNDANHHPIQELKSKKFCEPLNPRPASSAQTSYLGIKCKMCRKIICTVEYGISNKLKISDTLTLPCREWLMALKNMVATFSMLENKIFFHSLPERIPSCPVTSNFYIILSTDKRDIGTIRKKKIKLFVFIKNYKKW